MQKIKVALEKVNKIDKQRKYAKHKGLQDYR